MFAIAECDLAVPRLCANAEHADQLSPSSNPVVAIAECDLAVLLPCAYADQSLVAFESFCEAFVDMDVLLFFFG